MSVNASNTSSWVHVAIIGPHQHGKSTLTGFLLHSLQQLPARMNEAEKAALRRNDSSRKFAFLLDRKAHERKITTIGCRGTQETSWWTLRRNGHHYLFSNTPGCLDLSTFLPETLANADAVLLVVDTGAFLDALAQKQAMHENQMPDTLTQIYTNLSLARFYDVRQLVIALHKMDSIAFSKENCLTAKAHLERIAEELGWKPEEVRFVPTGVDPTREKGYNIIQPEPLFQDWFSHVPLLKTIEQLRPRLLSQNSDFRMQLSAINERGPVHVPGYQMSIAGKIVSGTVRVEDELFIQPSGMHCKVKSIQIFDTSRFPASKPVRDKRRSASAGEFVTLLCTTTDGDLRVRKGEVAGTLASFPSASQHLRTELIPLTTSPFRNLPTKKLSGTFVISYFHTSFSLEDVSLDEGITWMCKKLKSPHQKRQAVLHALTSSQPGTTILADIRLAQKAPLETYADNTILGRFVLFSSNFIPLFGGRITEIL